MIGLFCFLLNLLVSVYLTLIFIRIVLSWVHVDFSQPAIQLIYRLTTPVLEPARRYLPFLMISGIDFSPIAVVLGLQMIPQLLCSLF